MEPLPSELRVIEEAEALARTLGDDPNHTVAAVALDAWGRLHHAVNVFHFTGGPCAELVALGAAATAGAGPLVAIAAAGDRGRGLIPPCGRCRQVMLDHHPDFLVAVPTEDGPRMRPITKLLPDAYVFPDADAVRLFRLNKRYRHSVENGTKTSSVRWDESWSTGRVVIYFEDDGGAPLPAEITGVHRYRLDELTPDRLRIRADTSVDEYIAGLRRHYPAMPEAAWVDVVDFSID
ncbi:ASCH domain-containing protein [Microbacterium sp. SS28]|uniref:ASCH domain-containing protein n=1 Tax=Microbacterium sp. SS28 TaxID=2919948 RepID=UPI001FAAF854|nr:ASCH domain-containing protein [Microbacterium sp. SS28]